MTVLPLCLSPITYVAQNSSYVQGRHGTTKAYALLQAPVTLSQVENVLHTVRQGWSNATVRCEHKIFEAKSEVKIPKLEYPVTWLHTPK